MRNYSIGAVFAAFSLCASRLGATDHYVSMNSPSPAPPYTNWNTAAHVIQDAIDAANPGDTVNVTNGVYQAGGYVITNTYDDVTNRVAITKPLTVESVNGPAATIVQGYQVPGTTNGPGAVRGVYMTNNTALIGFTITLGATDIGNGGGVYCENPINCVLSNCVITANSAYYGAGGVSGGTLNNCVISSNSAFNASGGGAQGSAANHCMFIGNYAGFSGGGVDGNSGVGFLFDQYELTLTDCTFIGNSAFYGGGVHEGTLINCVLVNNQAQQGGGAYASFLYNCTVVSNSAPNGAGIADSPAMNCIVYYNNGPNVDQETQTQTPSYHTCTTPLPIFPDLGNFTNPPCFVDPAAGDFHLQSNSPCINAGNNALPVDQDTFPLPANALLTSITNDLNGNPRVVGGTVDAGAYEYQSPTSVISYAWLQQYGFPTDGSSDFADPDGDGMNNWQEWRAGTNPTNATSLLEMQLPVLSLSGTTLTWQSQANTYFLQRAQDLSAPFSTIQSNIIGHAGTTAYTDTNAVESGPFFYRVGVQEGVQRLPSQ